MKEFKIKINEKTKEKLLLVDDQEICKLIDLSFYINDKDIIILDLSLDVYNLRIVREYMTDKTEKQSKKKEKINDPLRFKKRGKSIFQSVAK